MATIHIESVPNSLYEALRARARSKRRSISAETLALLEKALPTARELRRRAAFCKRIQRLRAMSAITLGPSAEELLRTDRQR
jgi:plasmid stability protein